MTDELKNALSKKGLQFINTDSFGPSGYNKWRREVIAALKFHAHLAPLAKETETIPRADKPKNSSGRGLMTKDITSVRKILQILESVTPLPTKQPISSKPKLFISHASEDKADFVEPLAIALNQHYDVWYDKFSLKLGDQLLATIDEGLSDCDYAVVVLSHSFFSKSWPISELNGIFSLETAHKKKYILPIYHNITHEEVLSFSPILGARLGTSSANGVAAVIREINIATDVSSRVVETSSSSPVSRLQSLSDQITAQKEIRLLSSSEAGANIVNEEGNMLIQLIKESLAEFNCEKSNTPLIVKGEVSENTRRAIVFQSKFRLSSQIEYSNITWNSSNYARLKFGIFRDKSDTYHKHEFDEIHRLELSPEIIDSRTVKWISQDSEYSSEGLKNLILTTLIERIVSDFKQSNPHYK